jgi:general secretion pathway protein L
MPYLQIFLPEGWPESSMADITPLPWRLADGATTRQGESPIGSLPKSSEVELILPAGRVLLTRVKLPPGNTQKLGEVVGYAVEDRLLGDPESIHAAVGARSADGNVTVAVLDRAWLQSAREKFAAAGHRLMRAVSEVAIVPQTPGAWDLLWYGQHGALRTGEDLGSAVDGSGDGAPIALQLALQEARNGGAAPERIVVHDGTDGRHLLDLARWSAELGIPVDGGKIWRREQVEVPTRRGINLLQGGFATGRSSSELVKRYRLPLQLAAGVVGLGILVSAGDWAWLRWQKYAEQAKMVKIYRATFPDSTVKDELVQVQMGRNLADLRRAHGQAQAGDFIPLLSDALPVISATGGSAQSVRYERGKLQLDVRLAQMQSQDELNQRLSSAGIPAKVESVSSSQGGALARVTFSGGAT